MDPSAINLRVLRYFDPEIEAIVATNPGGCLYIHSEEKGRLVKDDIDGPLLLYQTTGKKGRAPFGWFILNRLGADNFGSDISSEEEWHINDNFITWHPLDGSTIRGLHVQAGADMQHKWYQVFQRAGERCRLKLEADRANDAAPPASIQPQRQPESVATPPVGQAISIDALFGSVAPPANPEPPAPASDNLFEQFFGSRPSESSPVDQSKVNMLDAIFASAAPQPASQPASQPSDNNALFDALAKAEPSLPATQKTLADDFFRSLLEASSKPTSHPPSQPSVDINSLMNALATADSVSLPAEQPKPEPVGNASFRSLLEASSKPSTSSQTAAAPTQRQPDQLDAMLTSSLPAAPAQPRQAHPPQYGQRQQQQPAINGHHHVHPPPAWQASSQPPRPPPDLRNPPTQTMAKAKPVRANNALIPRKVTLGRGPPPPVKESARPRDGPPSLSSSSGPSSPRSGAPPLAAASLVEDILSSASGSSSTNSPTKAAVLPVGLSKNDFARSLITLMNTDAVFVDSLYARYLSRS